MGRFTIIFVGNWLDSIVRSKEKKFQNEKGRVVVLGFRPSWDVGKGENRR
jgi:hypothetical protein